MKNKKILSITALTLAALACSALWLRTSSVYADKPPMPVRIMWLEWGAADIIQEVSKLFTEETGIPVILEQIPITKWQQITYKELETRYPRFDLVGGDSQWMGYGVENGYYVELTDFVQENRIEGVYSELATKGYGEYPPESGRYYAVPFGTNAMGYAYRKDWLEDPAEKAAFLARYGYEMRVPRTMNELRDVAEFFTRPEENKYGFIFGTGEVAYDAITISYGSLLFAFGGSWGDRARCVADGYVNNEGAVQALEFLKNLYGFTAPNSSELSYGQSVNVFNKGNTAIILNPMSVFPTIASPVTNPHASTTGYFGALFGPKSQHTQLVGQGVSLLRDARNPEGAQKFLEWWIRKGTQEEFASRGGFTAHREIIGTQRFLESAPYNAAFSESVELLQDYWNNPSYEPLLKISQKYLHEYVTGVSTRSAKETLDTIVREWNPILEKECK